MTATARLFREVLADQALTHSSTAEARDIVARAEQAVERYKADIAERASPAAPAKPLVATMIPVEKRR